MKKKISIGFCWLSSIDSKLKPCDLFCLKSLFWEICKKLLGCLQQFYHRFMYITPSSDHSLITLNLPVKVILQRFEVVFWCLELKCCTFQKIYGNPFNQPILYYGFKPNTVAVTMYVHESS